MTNILVDEPVRQKLSNLSQPVALVDEHGCVLGTFMPRCSKEPLLSDEELKRREQEAESFTTSEMLAYLEKL